MEDDKTCHYNIMKLSYTKATPLAQAVSRWISTVEARVRARGLVKWDLW
jgi:hypothetical protein